MIIRIVLALILCTHTSAVWAVACDAIFTNGVQSHVASGSVHLGYMSRVNGGSSVLDTPHLTMQSEWQDQAGLCNGVRCTASGQPTAPSSPAILTGSYIPDTFLTGNGSNGAINVPQGISQNFGVGDYATVTVQANNARLRFTGVNATYRMRSVTTNYRSVVEMQPGDYWINGNLELGQEMTLRRLNGSDGPVRLYVNGNVTTQKIFIEGFAPGQLMIYATGNISFGNETNIPGFVYARGNVSFTQNAVVSDGVYAPSFSTGNGMNLTYSEVDTDHFLGNFTADHQAIIKMQPGDYWFSGNLKLNEVTVERLNGSSNPVRIFVSGNIDIHHAAKFNHFGPGQLLIYSAQNISINSQQHVPAFIYAAGNIDIGFRSGVTGAVSGRQVSVGQESIVTYVTPSNLGALCTDGGGVAYYVLSHAGTGVTCEAEPVLVTAFDAANNPIAPSASTVVALTTVPGTGVWVGGNNYVFGGAETSFTKFLQQTTPAGLTINVTDGVASGTSVISFADTGLRFYDLPALPNSMVAGSNYSGATLRVVETNTDTGACEARVSGSSEVGLAYECLDPALCSAGQNFTVDGGSIAANNGGPISSYGNVTLNFDAAGTASIPLSFSDVGRVRLHGRLELPPQDEDPAITLIGDSADFIVKPYTVVIGEVRNSVGTVINPKTTTGGEGFVPAGDSFSVSVKACRYSEGIELDPYDNCVITPNFGNENNSAWRDVKLMAFDLVYPSVSDPTYKDELLSSRLTPGSFNDEGLNKDVSWNEVGSIRLRADLINYFEADGSQGIPGGIIGRFYPASFDITEPELTQSCNSFSYMEHPSLGVSFTVTAKNKFEQTVALYDNKALDYLTAGLNFVAKDIDEIDPDLVNKTSRMKFSQDVVENVVWEGGVLSFDDSAARFDRARSPDNPNISMIDGPFPNNLQLGVKLLELDPVDVEVTMNAASVGECTNNCDAYALGTLNQMRFGRVRLDDAFGPESIDLPVTFITEFWTGTHFARSGADTCTKIPLIAIEYDRDGDLPPLPVKIDTLANRTISLNGGSTQGIYYNLLLNPVDDHVAFDGGDARHFFSAPNPGTGNFNVNVNFGSESCNLLNDALCIPWLRYDWNQNGNHNDDIRLRANFGFGQYRGHDRIIYWREVFE